MRLRTVGDFFCGPSVHREGGTLRAVKDFHWKWGLLRPYRLMIVYAYALFNEWNGVHVAQKIQTLFIDDIDGSEAEGTVRFALDGAEYEIDLNAKNAAAFSKQLAPYLEHARRAGRAQPHRSGRAAAGRQRSGDIRAWAKEHGLQVSERGRIPASVAEQYRASANGR